MKTKLILIRHGQTRWNKSQRYCGWKDIGLNVAGKEQAKKLQQVIKNQVIDKIYVSDRKRAIDTAKLAFKGRKFEKVAGLREIHFGVFEGLNYKQIMKKYPVAWQGWITNPYTVRIPGAEYLPEFQKRVVKAIKKIVLKNKGKTVAVVCHGGVISIFLNYILHSRNFWKTIPGSTGVTTVEFTNNRGRLKRFNNLSHLGKENGKNNAGFRRGA